MEECCDLSPENPQNSVNTIKYVRPADRTPEKNFHEMSEQEKKHFSVTRSAVNRVRSKITTLEDELEKRDKEVDRERELRREAETKLESRLATVADMYGDPGVNQELRERLPRANKSDPFKRVDDASETDLSSIEEQIVAEEEGETCQAPALPGGGRSQEDQDSRLKDKPSHSSNPASSRRKIDFSSGADNPKVHTETQTNGLERPPTFPFTNFSPSQGYLGTSPYAPFNPYQGSSLPGTFQSPYLRSTLLPPSSLPRPQHSPLLSSPLLNPSFRPQSAPQEPILSKVTTAHTFAPPPQTVPSSASGETTSPGEATPAAAGASRGHSLLQPTLDSAAMASGGARSFLQSHAVPLQTSVLPDPFLPSVSPRLQASPSVYPEPNKQIAVLINEIDSQRSEVKKMRDSLAEKTVEIETLKVSLATRDVERHASTDNNADKAAGLVEEVYAAQKQRDEATSRRLAGANNERDDVMARLRELEARLDAQSNRGTLNHSPNDLQLEEEYLELEDIGLLSPGSRGEGAGSPPGSGLFRRVEAVKERQREVMREELQIVMEQRDVALARCHKLEGELLRYQRESDADGGMDKSIKAKLAAVQQERDMAVAKSKQLDDEIQTIRIYYSLHKSLSGENTVQQPSQHTHPGAPTPGPSPGPPDTLTRLQLAESRQEVEQVHVHNEQLNQENSQLRLEIQKNAIDKKQLQQALDSVVQEKERFQRLANVLRRKLNALTDETKGDEDKD